MVFNPQFYTDFEFACLNGPPISFALLSDDNNVGRYFIFTDWEEKLKEMGKEVDPWVLENVIPHLNAYAPHQETIKHISGDTETIQKELEKFLKEIALDGPGTVGFMADWPVDSAYLAQLLITGPGTMIDIPGYSFHVIRMDSYPSSDPHLIQHNALCDVFAMKLKLSELKEEYRNF